MNHDLASSRIFCSKAA